MPNKEKKGCLKVIRLILESLKIELVLLRLNKLDSEAARNINAADVKM